MLSIDQIQAIRDAFVAYAGNISRVSRACGVARATVRAALARDYSAPRRVKRRRNDVYDDAIESLLRENMVELRAFRKNRLTAKRIFQLLKQNNSCNLSLRSIQRKTKRLRSKIGAENAQSALFLASPAGHAQIDFGEILAEIDSKKQRLNLLICAFPHSNAAFAVVMPSQDRASLFEGLMKIFATLGGVPPVLRFDNLTPAVAKIEGRARRLTHDFERFMLHYGFKSEFCNPASGNEKGTVESKVKYIRQNFFVPAPKFSTLDALNAALATWCINDMARIHYRFRAQISALFADDSASLLPLPKSPFLIDEITVAHSDKRGFVLFDKNKYFVGVPLQSVTIHADSKKAAFVVDSTGKTYEYARAYGVGGNFQSALDLARIVARKIGALSYIVNDSAADAVAALSRTIAPLRPPDRVPFILDFLTSHAVANIKLTEKAIPHIDAQSRAPDLSIYDNLVGSHGT